MRASLITTISVLFCLSATTFGCDRQQENDQVQSQDTQVGDQERPELVASGGPIEITLENVIKTANRLRLLAPGVVEGNMPTGEPEWLQMPHAQAELVRNLIHFQILRHGAAARGLEISAADETSFVAKQPILKRYLPLFQNGDDADELRQELEEVDLGFDDVRSLVHDMLLTEMLEEELAQEFSDEQLWSVYQNAYDKADMIAVRIHNTPSTDEINRAVSQYDREIRSYYREHRDQRYVIAEEVYATTFRPGDDVDPAAATELLEQAVLRIDDGEDPDAVGEELGLVVDDEVRIRRQRHRPVYEAELNETGIYAAPKEIFAWRIDRRTESRTRSLDRPLRREIASVLLREDVGITPSNLIRAQQAADILSDHAAGSAMESAEIEALVAHLQEEGFDARHTGLFSIRLSGAIPEIGLAENLQEAISNASLEEPVTKPILDRDAAYVARLVDRRHPDREAFEDDRDEFRHDFIERNRSRFVQQFVTDFRNEHEFTINLRLVADHFGVVDSKDMPQGQPPQGGQPSQAQPPQAGPDQTPPENP